MFIFATGMSRLRTSVKSLKAEGPTLRARGLPTTSNKQPSRLRCHPQALTRSARVPSPQSPKLQLVRRVRLGPLHPLLIPLRPLLHKLRSSHASLLSASQRLYHKTSTFCHGSVNSYTGYINVEARHPFFYFFQSRRDPCKDEVIFWTHGGPGCSQPWACSWSWVCAGLSRQSWNKIILSVSGFRMRSTGSGFLVMLVSTNSICPDLTVYVSVEWIQLTLVPFVT